MKWLSSSQGSVSVTCMQSSMVAATGKFSKTLLTEIVQIIQTTKDRFGIQINFLAHTGTNDQENSCQFYLIFSSYLILSLLSYLTLLYLTLAFPTWATLPYLIFVNLCTKWLSGNSTHSKVRDHSSSSESSGWIAQHLLPHSPSEGEKETQCAYRIPATRDGKVSTLPTLQPAAQPALAVRDIDWVDNTPHTLLPCDQRVRRASGVEQRRLCAIQEGPAIWDWKQPLVVSMCGCFSNWRSVYIQDR